MINNSRQALKGKPLLDKRRENEIPSSMKIPDEEHLRGRSREEISILWERKRPGSNDLSVSCSFGMLQTSHSLSIYSYLFPEARCGSVHCELRGVTREQNIA